MRAREGFVLDGSEHGRTMMEIGDQNCRQRSADTEDRPLPAASGKRCTRSNSSHSDLRGSDRNPNGRRRRPSGHGGSGRRPTHARRLERDPTEGREPPASFASRSEHMHMTDGGQCRAQGSLRGRIARLRMGFVEKMPHLLPARCVQGPPRSVRGQSARRPGRDALRLRGSFVVADQAGGASIVLHSNTVPLRQMACRMTASLRATAMEARFQPMRLARRNAHCCSGQDRRSLVMSTPAAS